MANDSRLFIFGVARNEITLLRSPEENRTIPEEKEREERGHNSKSLNRNSHSTWVYSKIGFVMTITLHWARINWLTVFPIQNCPSGHSIMFTSQTGNYDI